MGGDRQFVVESLSILDESIGKWLGTSPFGNIFLRCSQYETSRKPILLRSN